MSSDNSHYQQHYARGDPRSPANVTAATSVAASASSDLKSRLNASSACNVQYTKIGDLRADIPYPIASFERVNSPYGETLVVYLEGVLDTEDRYLRVYLPRRYNDAMTDHDVLKYNNGYSERLMLVRRSGPPGSTSSPLEFV